MNADFRTPRQRLSGFLKWFFNASPVWVDERTLLTGSSHGERRAFDGRTDRRRFDGAGVSQRNQSSRRSGS